MAKAPFGAFSQMAKMVSGLEQALDWLTGHMGVGLFFACPPFDMLDSTDGR